VQVAEAAPAELAIGTLSTGGDVTPQSQQQAQDMISSILKRISALSTKTAETQKRQIRQIRYFIKQAQQALNSGDAEGAKNLAIKASLLMDDLEKK
jgi:gas vesicle protein